jgi:hypothetical protein
VDGADLMNITVTDAVGSPLEQLVLFQEQLVTTEVKDPLPCT